MIPRLLQTAPAPVPPTIVPAFEGRYRFLSNFFAVPIEMDGTIYRSVEHAYQASKTFVESARIMIWSLPRAGAAKRAGREVPIRPDWESVKLGVMRSLLHKKFAEDPLRGKLLATGDAELVEGNDWGDRFWGRVDGVGDNHLGRLLMQVRDEIRKGVDRR